MIKLIVSLITSAKVQQFSETTKLFVLIDVKTSCFMILSFFYLAK